MIIKLETFRLVSLLLFFSAWFLLDVLSMLNEKYFICTHVWTMFLEFIFQSRCVLAFNKIESFIFWFVQCALNMESWPRTLVFCNLLCGVVFGVFVLCPSQNCTNLAANWILIYFSEVYCLQLEVFFRLDAVLIFHCKGLAVRGLLAEIVRTRSASAPGLRSSSQVWAFLKYTVISARFHKYICTYVT